MNELLKKGLLVFSIASPLLLLILPKDFFDTGLTICIHKNLFDFDCPGCGLTRALMHLLHLDFISAWSFSPIAFVVAPILAMLWLHIGGKLINKPVFRFFEKFY